MSGREHDAAVVLAVMRKAYPSLRGCEHHGADLERNAVALTWKCKRCRLTVTDQYVAASAP